MSKKKLMVVEDEAVTAMDLKSNLVQLGYDVPSVVTNGEDAIRIAAELRPDLVLMDITLKGPMSGIEAADEIRKSLSIPIVFLTAHTDTETIERAKTAEPFGYLPKPASMDTLISTIEVALYKNKVDAQRRKAEKALKKSEERYRTVANFTYAWEFWVGPDERIIYSSPSCEKMTGHPADAFEKDPSLLHRIIHPEDLAVYDKHRHDVKTEPKAEEIEFRIIRTDGSIRWISHVCQPVFNDQGQFNGTRGSNRDITEHKIIEEELIKTRNLESLSILAGGIAHDFNNLLQVLLGNLDMAKHYTSETSKAFPFLENAKSSYDTAINLTNQLIALTPGGILEKKTIQPNKIIREIVALTIGSSNIKTAYELQDDLGLILVDPRQFSRAITNITLNAVESMPTGGTLFVSAVNIVLKPHDIVLLAPGQYIQLSFRDEGQGIAPDILPRIFDPYFSTKERGSQKGMGLGLTVTDAIVKKHYGAITVESEHGKGSTFHIYLPVALSNA